MAIHATSLKLPADLKARVEAAAKRAGTSAHAFMMEAIARETSRAERYAEFLDEAKQADADFERTGTYFESDEVFDYLTARIGGTPARRPRPKKWRR